MWLAEALKGQARLGSCAFCLFCCCLVLVLFSSRTAGVRAGRDDVCFTCLLLGSLIILTQAKLPF